jgi:hypothetical protein
MLKAEPEAQRLSQAAATLYRQTRRLSAESEELRPLIKREQASEALGRRVRPLPGGPDPYYITDVLEEAKGTSPLRAGGGGKGVPKELGSRKQNLGRLFLSGKLHLRNDILGPEFLKRVKLLKYDEIHNALRRGAVRVSRADIERDFGGKLPKDWEYLHTKPQTFKREVSAEAPGQMTLFGPGKTTTEKVRVGGRNIPAMIRPEGDAPFNALNRAAGDMSEAELADRFTTSDPSLAHMTGEHYYIVPKRMTKSAVGEFTRSNDFVRAFIQKPLTVWRSLVLGLRVGFLTNNIVGNSAMYAVRTGGRGAIRDLFASIAEHHGAKIAQRVIDDASTPPELRQELQSWYDQHFPEQSRSATLGATQSPSTSLAGQAASRAGRVYRDVTGVLPHLSSVIGETPYRRALVRNMIRKSPEFRQVWRDMPKQTRTFEEAASKILQGKGGKTYQRMISKQVDDALGNYLNLSPFARNVARQAIPFYTWYRAITRATYTLARDTPLRANILGKIGQIGSQRNQAALGEVPSWLQGAVPFGPGPQGTQRVLSTQGFNPWATLNQLPRGLSDIGSFGVNPFAMGLLDTAQHWPSGKPLTLQGLVGTTLANMTRNLPLSTVIAPPPPSALYPTRGRKAQIESYLGVPFKEYSPGEARKRAASGQ